MMAFWSIAILLMIGALLFLLPPLLRRQEKAAEGAQDTANLVIYREQFAQINAELARGRLTPQQHREDALELERRALEASATAPASGTTGSRSSRWLSVSAVALGLPVMAVSLYLALGRPAAIGSSAQASDPHHAATPEQVIAMVEKLALRMKERPDDIQGWTMLARSYNALGRHEDAALAYDILVQRAPASAQLYADYADVLAMANGKSLEGKPAKLVVAALELDPRNQKALALAGTAAFDRRDYAEAISYWQRLQQTVPADSEDARSVAASITEARSLARVPAAGRPTDNQQASAATAGRVSGTVGLNPALAARVAPTDTLFIYARAPQGPKMPLAIVRAQAKELPRRFTLDDSLAMAPNIKPSNFARLLIEARISKSGNAMPQSGDLQGILGPVEIGSADVKLVIDQVIP